MFSASSPCNSGCNDRQLSDDNESYLLPSKDLDTCPTCDGFNNLCHSKMFGSYCSEAMDLAFRECPADTTRKSCVVAFAKAHKRSLDFRKSRGNSSQKLFICLRLVSRTNWRMSFWGYKRNRTIICLVSRISKGILWQRR